MKAGIESVCIWEKCILGRGTSWCKGLKVGVCLMGIAKSPRRPERAKEEWKVGDEIWEVASLQSHCHAVKELAFIPGRRGNH